MAGQLGLRTAELHQALAKPTRNPAFSPEPVNQSHLSQWAADAKAQAQTALAGLQRTKGSLDRATTKRAEQLLAEKERLVDRALRPMSANLNIHLTRLHGDYHLGQVLVSQDDVSIIDFEGEPLRPLAERRSKHLPLRDVAGMLRSFTYAAGAAERQTGLGSSDKLLELSQKASEAFLVGYHRAIQGCPSFPSNLAAANDLLHAFLLNKALYEVNYEIANRPDWIGIPLASVLDLLNEKDLPRFAELATAPSSGSGESS